MISFSDITAASFLSPSRNLVFLLLSKHKCVFIVIYAAVVVVPYQNRSNCAGLMHKKVTGPEQEGFQNPTPATVTGRLNVQGVSVSTYSLTYRRHMPFYESKTA